MKTKNFDENSHADTARAGITPRPGAPRLAGRATGKPSKSKSKTKTHIMKQIIIIIIQGEPLPDPTSRTWARATLIIQRDADGSIKILKDREGVTA